MNSEKNQWKIDKNGEKSENFENNKRMRIRVGVWGGMFRRFLE
jgi:hypothetical protein